MTENTPPTALVNTLHGDNTTAHVASATIIGGACASIISWGLQLAHFPPTPEVTAAFGVLFAVGASYVMQKVGN